jgi:hypothetical protein
MAAVLPITNVHDQRADKLADEITELYSLITAATCDLLVKVREFDYWWDEDGSLVFRGRLPGKWAPC